MAHVRFTKNLYRFFPDLTEGDVAGATVAALVQNLDQRYPNLAAYIVDESGRLRPHVNIFVDGAMVTDREKLLDPLTESSAVYVVQALSGG